MSDLMIPAPTQPPPTQIVPAAPQIETPNEERPKVALTPARRRPGQTPLARTIKAIFRPVFKILYYIISWIRTHKLVSLLALALLIGSIVATSYFVGNNAPLASQDSMKSSVQKNTQISPDVQNWLLGLRDGKLNTMLEVEKAMSTVHRPPDSSLYVLQFSEKYNQVKWTNVSVTSINAAPDGMIDTFIETDLTVTSTSSTSTSTAPTRLIVLWHFTTLANGQIYLIDYVSARSA
ncbi:hypothetical protein [Dictyobacter arantiisoli]|uniref:Uncharacterized protein n=1 Tax=Dictyobacter arantiisoli TaxID=2014874 RepID=A0A5A5T7P0_9CHLR|nr:hypothetical protein [Dictyobacter arantiisoli]GCF07471.1 hypothetical protein KDI_10350 [Dictyobacter arantiisoli]